MSLLDAPDHKREGIKNCLIEHLVEIKLLEEQQKLKKTKEYLKDKIKDDEKEK